MDSGETGMNPVTMSITNSGKEYWPSRESNQRPPVCSDFAIRAWHVDMGGEMKNLNECTRGSSLHRIYFFYYDGLSLFQIVTD